MARATAGPQRSGWVWLPAGIVLLSVLLILLSMAPIGPHSGLFSYPALFIVGVVGALAGCGVAALQASWIGEISEKRVVLRKPPLLQFFLVLWVVLLPLGLAGRDHLDSLELLRANRAAFSQLFDIFIALGIVGLPFLPLANPVWLECDPQASRYRYRAGVYPFRHSHRGELYDMLGLRVDDERGWYVMRVTWRAKRWKIVLGRFKDRKYANDLARQVSRAIGTSYWPAD
jgi:hypothetical protein